MKLWQILPDKRYKVVVISILVIISIYLFFQFFLFKSDLIVEVKSYLAKSYLLSLEKFAALLLSLSGSHVTFDHLLIISNNNVVSGFNPDVRYEGLAIILIILIWLTKAPDKERFLFTLFLLIAHSLSNGIYIAAGAYSAAAEKEINLALLIPDTLGLVIIFTIFFLWFRSHKRIILSSLSKYKINTSLLENDFNVILFIYAFVLITCLLINFFDFRIWIGFLYASAQKILALFGYEAFTDNFRLAGTYGNVTMSKACMGFHLMLLFVAMIMLTGNTTKLIRLIYIMIGLLFLNFLNILRLVFLFIHLQKHQNYLLSIDAHNLFNYIIYAIVFILWIIWFEKFADIKTRTGISNQETI